MAYGLKYELLCKSIAANNYKLKLLFDGYTDADIDRNMPKDQPLVLKKDRAAIVRGTSLDFGIREEVDFELDEFYTNNPKKIKAELYKDTTLLWTGYVLPQQYQAPYVPVPLTVRFTATDGLGLLKNETFALTGLKSQLEILIYCIDKIGLALGYSIAINLFEATHAENRSPLAQTFEDAEIYEDDNCYEVIEKILQKYDAEITQLSGRWHITCSADKKSTRMLYTTTGVYETTAAAPTVLDLGYPNTAGIEVHPIGLLNRGMEAGGKKIILKHNYGRKESLLDNYAFWRYSGGVFSGWTKVGTFNTYQRILEGEAYAFLQGGDSTGAHQIYQEIDLTNPSGEDFVFELHYSPIGKNTDGSIGAINMTVRIAVAVLVGATAYYLTETGTWTTTPTIITKTVLSSVSAPVWNLISIMADGLPGSGPMTVALYRYGEEETPHTGDVFSGIAFRKPKVYFLSDGQLYPSGVETLAVFDNSTEPDDLGTISLSAADGPSVDNVTLLYEYITKLSSGAATTLWHRLGSASEYLFMVQLARALASRNRVTKQKLTGTIKGTGINFGSIIKHTYNSSREFEIAEGGWDMYNETWIITLLEILAWSDEDITFTNTEENNATESATGDYVGNVTTNTNVPSGAQGPQGDRGFQGDPGVQGPQGYQGYQGYQGVVGSGIRWTGEWNNFTNYSSGDGVSYNGEGFIALLANSDVTPADGPYWNMISERGAPGTDGDDGARGFQGEVGDTGPQGDPGPPGPQGYQGDIGDPGVRGYQGYQGHQGVQGHVGVGLQGEMGDTGPQGNTGPQGPQGYQGDIGDTGVRGYQGYQGNTGGTGPQGATGARGLQGEVGDTGPQGSPGAPGSQGPQGDDGAAGVRGYQGYQGNAGSAGPQGPQGLPGSVSGYSGTVTYTFTSMTFSNGLLQSTS